MLDHLTENEATKIVFIHHCQLDLKGGILTWLNKYDQMKMTEFLQIWPTLRQWWTLFIQYDQNLN